MADQQDLLAALVEFSDTLVRDHDVVEFLHRLTARCVDLVDTSEAGIMLADRDCTLQHVVASNDRTSLLALEQLRHDEGPSLDSYRSAAALHCGFLTEHRRWPRFAPRAQQVGFESVSVLPMRLRSDVIGVLNLYSESPDPLESDDRMAAQALADIATIGILQARALRDERTVNFQLENALTSRILIEQAKGVMAERFGITVDVAFQLIRDHTRSHNCPLSDTARDIIDGDAGTSAAVAKNLNGSVIPARSRLPG